MVRLFVLLLMCVAGLQTQVLSQPSIEIAAATASTTYSYDSGSQLSTGAHLESITAAPTNRDRRPSATMSGDSPRAMGHCVAAEETTVARRSLDELSQQGAQADRNGLTQAGRALPKHANRAGNSAYPKVPGGELNGAGQDVLDEILTNPMTAERSYVSPNYGPVSEFLLPDMGARFEEFGRLIGFL